MSSLRAARSLRNLSDNEIKDCLEGKVSILIVKNIFTCPGVIKHNGFILTDRFAELFASFLQGFIDHDEETQEWEDADFENYEWGMTIACNINNLLMGQEQLD
jgi:hypothetical protein